MVGSQDEGSSSGRLSRRPGPADPVTPEELLERERPEGATEAVPREHLLERENRLLEAQRRALERRLLESEQRRLLLERENQTLHALAAIGSERASSPPPPAAAAPQAPAASAAPPPAAMQASAASAGPPPGGSTVRRLRSFPSLPSQSAESATLLADKPPPSTRKSLKAKPSASSSCTGVGGVRRPVKDLMVTPPAGTPPPPSTGLRSSSAQRSPSVRSARGSLGRGVDRRVKVAPPELRAQPAPAGGEEQDVATASAVSGSRFGPGRGLVWPKAAEACGPSTPSTPSVPSARAGCSGSSQFRVGSAGSAQMRVPRALLPARSLAPPPPPVRSQSAWRGASPRRSLSLGGPCSARVTARTE